MWSQIDYFLRIDGEEIYNIGDSNWMGYSFSKEKNITKDVKEGCVGLIKLGNVLEIDRKIASTVRYDHRKMVQELRPKRPSEEANAIALLGKIKSKRYRENGIQMDEHRAEFQFYKMDPREKPMKKFR